MDDYIFKQMHTDDLHTDLFIHFNRFQRIEQSWALKNGEWRLIHNPFNYDWDTERKHRTINELKGIKNNGGIVYGVFYDNKLIAFSSVGPKFSESHMEGYIPIGFIHVSLEHRNKGIGKKLFAMMYKKAKDFGALKLYICIMPAEESNAFYTSIGCVDAVVVYEPLEDGDFGRLMEFVL